MLQALVAGPFLLALCSRSSLEVYPTGSCAEPDELGFLQKDAARMMATARHSKAHIASIAYHGGPKRRGKRLFQYSSRSLTQAPCKHDDCDDYMNHFAQALCAAQNYLLLPNQDPCDATASHISKNPVFKGKSQDFLDPVVKPGNCNATGGMWWEFGRAEPTYSGYLELLEEISKATCKYDDNKAALWNYVSHTWPGNEADIVPPFCADDRWDNWWTVWSKSFTSVNTETLYADFYSNNQWQRPNTAMINACLEEDAACKPFGEGAQQPLESSFFYAVEVPEMIRWAKNKKTSPPPLKLYSISDNCGDVLGVFEKDYPDWVTGQDDGVTCVFCPGNADGDGWKQCILEDPLAFANCGQKDGFPPTSC